jgi:hypothetical protein
VGNLSSLEGSNNRNLNPNSKGKSAAGSNPHSETLSAIAPNREGS